MGINVNTAFDLRKILPAGGVAGLSESFYDVNGYVPTFRSQLAALSAKAWLPVSGYCYKEVNGSRVTAAESADDPVGEVVEWVAGGGSYFAPSNNARPLLKISGGLRYLQFDGVDDVLTASAASNAQHACTAGRVDGATFPSYVGFLTGAGEAAGELVLIGDLGLTTWFTSHWNAYRLNGVGRPAPWPGPLGAEGVMTVTKSAAVSLRSQVGSDRDIGGSRFLAGRWYGTVIAPAAVSADDQGIIESYLAGLCGVTLP